LKKDEVKPVAQTKVNLRKVGLCNRVQVRRCAHGDLVVALILGRTSVFEASYHRGMISQ